MYGFLVLLVGAMIYFVKPAIKWWRKRPWQMKGLALRGATAVVEKVMPVVLDAARDAEDDSQPRHHFLVEVTIVPASRLNQVPWTPTDLRIVPAVHWNPDSPDNRELHRYCHIEALELICDNLVFTPDEAFTVVGKFDLRLFISVRHDMRALQFRYYLEEFGAFELPAFSVLRMATERSACGTK